MTATLEFTTRFYKDAKVREFASALDNLRETIRDIQLNGPAFNKQRVKPLSHTTKRNIWRIRVNIQPAPYRLFFEWISNGPRPTLRFLTFIPKKHRYCAPKHSSEIEQLSTKSITRVKHAELEAKMFGATHYTKVSTDGEKVPIETDESRRDTLLPNTPDPTPALPISPTPVGIEDSEEILIEPADPEDLIEIYATRELIQGFANLHGFSGPARMELGKCSTTDEALDIVHNMNVGASERFLDFLFDQDSPNDMERFYKMSGEDFISINKRSLSSFMLAIDAEQQEAIDKPLGGRPFMITGSAGTGKSIVCLYRLRRMIESRTNETLFDGETRPSYLFVTYTNSLKDSSQKIFEELNHDLDLSKCDIRFSTLDNILKEVSERLRKLGLKIPRPEKFAHSTAYWKTIKDDSTPPEEKRLLEEVGLDFFKHEVDEVLVDRNVLSLLEYLETGKKKEIRKGLIIPLREAYRKAIWRAYQQLLADMDKTGKAPYSLCRKALIEVVLKEPDALPKNNVVIADEIQDLGDTQLKLITMLVKSPAGLLLARDSCQTIFRRRASISMVDPSLNFNSQNSVTLKRSYRMTRQIHTALTPLRLEMNRVRSRIEETAKPVYNGYKPRWIRADSSQHHRIIADDIQKQIPKIHPSQFAILFATNEEAESFHKSQNKKIPTRLHKNHDSLPIDERAVHLLTAHSAKGLEFPHVYIPHSIRLAAPRKESTSRFDMAEQIDTGIKLFYVAGSRASSTLTILQESTASLGPLKILKKADWNHINRAGELANAPD